MVYVFVCVHLRLPYDCVMIVVLLIPACLFYLTRTLGRNRHAICGSPMIVIHTYIHTYRQRPSQQASIPRMTNNVQDNMASSSVTIFRRLLPNSR